MRKLAASLLPASLLLLSSSLWAQQPSPSPSSSQAESQSEPATTVRVDVNLVNVFVTVTDAHGAPVAGLTKDNFVLMEEGHEQKIAVFNKESALPLSIALAIDTSLSTRHDLPLEQASAKRFARAIVRPVDALSVYDFSEVVHEDTSGFTADLKRIEEGTRRMGLLVDELLNLARLGRHALKLQDSNLNAVVEEVVSLLQPEANGRAVSWKIAELPPVKCDVVLVKQVFQNLLANALKFTRSREHPMIEISQLVENGQPVIAIRDNGVGFNMKYQDKLFGVFQRLHRAEDFEGTGIGLATVQRIIHKHGGRVWAEAEPDKGATFYFTLGVGEAAEARLAGVKPGEIATQTTAAGA